jgi:tRNA-specific 2-thiouridylase
MSIFSKSKTEAKKGLVYVGISGGVDSAVTAFLLQQQGYTVHGVFIKTWQPEWAPCTWREERRDAMRVCAALDIPFHTFDAEQAYKHDVADYMIAEYKAGRTPNPDVMCNTAVKFGAFATWAFVQGAQYVATGHYAQTTSSAHRHAFARAIDPQKDQVYFLWNIPQVLRERILFPLGALRKTEVRAIAARQALPVATKKDSQGICFLGDIDIKTFLSHYVTLTPGPVCTPEGKVIGEHQGALVYTLGERHGFTIHHNAQTPQNEPLFVIAKDIVHNTITVAPKKHGAPTEKVLEAERYTFTIEKCVWHAGTSAPSLKPQPAECQVRYHGATVPCTFTATDTTVTIHTTQPVLAVPGQSAVLYGEKGVVLVGGIIS